MAYSDYGGYAYRNGERVESRSDCTITPEGDTFGTPGSWPGFGMMAAGVPRDEIKKRIEWPSGHAVLGDGPVYLVLYKTWGTLYRGPEDQNLPIDRGDDYYAAEIRRTAELDGCRVDVIYTHEDNYYVYARLTQPDGNVWHGWSGYGVGAGLEDCDYGYSTSEREETLWSLFDNPQEISTNPGEK
jgi:hypothetical protein